MEKLLVNLPEFNETQRQMIRKAADLKNYTAVFFDETEDALSEAADASVILSGNPALVLRRKNSAGSVRLPPAWIILSGYGTLRRIRRSSAIPPAPTASRFQSISF